MLIGESLPVHAPLITYGCGKVVLTRHDAVAGSQQVVALAGLAPAEFGLHPLWIGGATHLPATGVILGGYRDKVDGSRTHRPAYVWHYNATCASVRFEGNGSRGGIVSVVRYALRGHALRGSHDED